MGLNVRENRSLRAILDFPQDEDLPLARRGGGQHLKAASLNMTALQTPGLLWNSKWIPPVRNYGGDVPTLQQLLLRYGEVIFPGHFIAPFELILSVDPQEDQAVADLALVSKDYIAWHILFVAPHSTTDQQSLRTNLETALLSPYGNREATELKRQINDLDEEKTRALVTDGPRFVIITDNPRHRLDDEFNELQVDIMIVEPFQLDDEFVFRINGKNPALPEPEVLALCNSNPDYAGSLVVQWIALDEAPPQDTIELTYQNAPTNWQVYENNARRILIPEEGRSPLREDPPFEIVKEADGNYSLRKIIKGA